MIIIFESEIVDQEICFLRDRIKYSNQKIEKLTEEDKLKDYELEFLQLKVSDEKTSFFKSSPISFIEF